MWGLWYRKSTQVPQEKKETKVWFECNNLDPTTEQQKKTLRDCWITLRDDVKAKAKAKVQALGLVSIPVTGLCTAAALGSLGTVVLYLAYTRGFKRINHVDWVTPPLLNRGRRIRGIVTS